MKKKSWALLCGFLVLSWSCSAPESEGDDATARQATSFTGEVEVWLGAQQGLRSASGLTEVLLTISGEGISPPLQQRLAPSGGPGAPSWGGLIRGIPVGTGRTFEVQGLDAEGALRFTGRAENVSITAGAPAMLYIVAQEVTPAETFENHVPILRTIVVSQKDVAPGETIQLRAAAFDPDGDPLTYTWGASAGTFGSPAGSATSWAAPTSPERVKVTLTLSVSDSRGATVRFTFVVAVGDTSKTGEAEVTVVSNPAPLVVGIEAVRVYAPDGTSVLSLDAKVEGHELATLSYLWSSSCGLTFSPPTAPKTRAVLPVSGALMECRVTLTVKDASGGVGTGSVLVELGQPVQVVYPPTIVEQCQSAASVPAGSSVQLSVTGSDPNRLPISISWFNVTAGTYLSTTDIDPATGQASATWQLPPCLTTARTETAFFLLQNGLDLTTVGTFFVEVTPNCTTSCSAEGTCEP